MAIQKRQIRTGLPHHKRRFDTRTYEELLDLNEQVRELQDEVQTLLVDPNSGDPEVAPPPSNRWAIVNIAGDEFLIAQNQLVRAKCGALDISPTLPPSAEAIGLITWVKKMDPGAGRILIVGHEGELMDGRAEWIIQDRYQQIGFVATGSGWDVIGGLT